MSKKRANGEGNIRKRKDGRWEGRYTAGYDPATGKRIIRNVLGKTQAEVKEKLLQSIEESKQLDVGREDYTVAQWLRLWYEIYAQPNMRTATANRYQLIIECYTLPYSGLHKGELVALRWDDVDTEHNVISVSRQLVRNPDGSLELTQPKTDTSIRQVSIPQEAVDLLIQEHNLHPDNPYLFPSSTTGKMYHPDSVVNLHEKILRDAGLPHIRFHDLRHTFATTALQNGVDIKTVSAMLGHYDAGFTLKTYTHATRQKQDEAAEVMGNFMSQVM